MNDVATAEVVLRLVGGFIKDVGFPIFVAVYLLVKINPALAMLTKAITDLREVMQIASGLTHRWKDPKP